MPGLILSQRKKVWIGSHLPTQLLGLLASPLTDPPPPGFSQVRTAPHQGSPRAGTRPVPGLQSDTLGYVKWQPGISPPLQEIDPYVPTNIKVSVITLLSLPKRHRVTTGDRGRPVRNGKGRGPRNRRRERDRETELEGQTEDRKINMRETWKIRERELERDKGENKSKQI